MKKLILLTAGLSFTIAGFAQKLNIQNASNSLKERDYTKALEYINLAAADPSTKDEPKTYYMKGNIYMAMLQDPKYKSSAPYREAAKAFMKTIELKNNYEKEAIDQNLLIAAYNFYNDAAGAYNDKQFDQAYEYGKMVGQIHDLDGGKRYASNKSFDTVAMQAKQIGALGAYYANKYDEALPLLNDIKNDPIVGGPNVYLMIADVYKKQNKNEQFMTALTEASTKFPDNQNVRNEQLNYYIKSGQTDVIIKKLEDALAKDPNNADYMYNLANMYNTVANPKDATGKELPRPANSAELMDKAEKVYLSALKIDPNNVGYNFNTGALYYNKATEINGQMNAVSGNTATEQKKYDELKKKRDMLFDQAIPYLEKSYTQLEPNVGKLSDDDKFTHQLALVALREIYARQNKLDKAKELKEKLDASRTAN